MEVYFTSDLHFGHERIIALCERGFTSIDEMNETLIEHWNKKVTDKDTVYILGDFAFRSATHVGTYLEQLKGKKHLIIGNHDNTWMKNIQEMGKYFESVSYMDVIKYEKKVLTLCHYPLLEWGGSRHSQNIDESVSYLVHGHIHNTRNDATFRFIRDNLPCALNAGVDVNNFEPVTFEELIVNNKSWYARP